MIKKSRVLPFVVALVVAISGTALADKPAAKAEKKVEKKAEKKPSPASLLSDPNKVVMVSAKKPEFTIELRSNPTTGYSWVLLDDYDYNLLKLVGHKYYAPDSKMMGAPGMESFKFTVREQGFKVPQKTQITLQYVRPWVATNNTQSMTFTIVTQSDASADFKVEKKKSP